MKKKILVALLALVMVIIPFTALAAFAAETTYTITVEVAALEAEFTVSFKEITSETAHGIAVGGEYYYFTVDDEIDGVVYKIEYKVYLCANCGNFVVDDFEILDVITPATPVEP